MPTHTGRCLCGASRIEFDGKADFCILCYCTDCQKVTGSGHAQQIAVKVVNARMSGALKGHHAASGKGNALEFGFCRECGSPNVQD